MYKKVVAIDGPAGSGKSTVAKSAAAKLNFFYLDTGAMYRGVALLALRNNISNEDVSSCAKLAQQADFRFEPGTPQKVFLNNEDITEAIRTMEIAEKASAISAIPEVRRELVKKQKQILEKGSAVLEGRDTTTVVCPEALLKIYLTATLHERARRRWLELQNKNSDPPKIEEIQAQLAQRDARDANREDSPLRIAPDAVIIETDFLTPDEVIQRIIKEWEKALKLSLK